MTSLSHIFLSSVSDQYIEQKSKYNDQHTLLFHFNIFACRLTTMTGQKNGVDALGYNSAESEPILDEI